ncbi:MAG: DUF3500 domain-containing protein [Cyanobacteria bacterium J06639_1]
MGKLIMYRRHLLLKGSAIAASAWLAQFGWARSQSDAMLASPLEVAVDLAFQTEMAERATAFLQALDARQQQRAVFSFESDERTNWHYMPRSRQGIAFKEMTANQRRAAERLLQFALSETGYRKVQNVITLETVLQQLGGSPSFRDPELYFLTVFGTPAQAPWGWRFEGHHLSLNVTVSPDTSIALTPAFWGANPAEVPVPPHRGLRPLANEQDVAFDLLRSLTAAERERGLLADRSFGDIVAGPGRTASLGRVEGLQLGDMQPASRDLALRLVETYVGNMSDDLARQQRQQIRAAGSDRIRFAWAGAIDPGRAHYYRLHGPSVLLEYDNTQNDANHIHTVWRDLNQDFGGDALRAHYERGTHAHRFARCVV